MINLLFPRQCLVCGIAAPQSLCPRCAPFGLHRVPSPAATLCGVLATARYQDPVARAIRRAKYGADRATAAGLARAWAEHVVAVDTLAQFDAIVPAPSPLGRRAQRGFSLPSLLAGALAGRTGVPRVHALWDHGGTPQASLHSTEARAANLAGRIRSLAPVSGRVLLVDDVLTTGATALACADELLGDATDQVWLATVCVADRRKPQTSVQNL